MHGGRATDLPLPGIAVPGAIAIGAAATALGDDTALARARAAFAEANALILPHAFDPAFLNTIAGACRRAEWVEEQIGTIGWRTIEAHDRAGAALRFAFDRANFLRWIEAASGCAPLRQTTGVVAEMAAGTDQGLGWHDDCNAAGRLLALIVHLSDAPYEGGTFELAEKESGRLLARVGQLAPGSAMLFRVDSGLRHRVTPVTRGGPRRVFAGWLNG